VKTVKGPRSVPVRVDTRVELLTRLWRLSGAQDPNLSAFAPESGALPRSSGGGGPRASAARRAEGRL